MRPEPPIEAPRRHYGQPKVVKHVARSPPGSESSEPLTEAASGSDEAA